LPGPPSTLRGTIVKAAAAAALPIISRRDIFTFVTPELNIQSL
jgi:hypothetical protein